MAKTRLTPAYSTRLGKAYHGDALAFTPDGRHLASAGGNDRTIRLWDVETGKEVRESR